MKRVSWAQQDNTVIKKRATHSSVEESGGVGE